MVEHKLNKQNFNLHKSRVLTRIVVHLKVIQLCLHIFCSWIQFYLR